MKARYLSPLLALFTAFATLAATPEPSPQQTELYKRTLNDLIKARDEARAVHEAASKHLLGNIAKVTVKSAVDTQGWLAMPGMTVFDVVSEGLQKAAVPQKTAWGYGTKTDIYRSSLGPDAGERFEDLSQMYRTLQQVLMTKELSVYDSDKPPFAYTGAYWSQGDGKEDDWSQLLIRRTYVIKQLSRDVVAATDREISALTAEIARYADKAAAQAPAPALKPAGPAPKVEADAFKRSFSIGSTSISLEGSGFRPHLILDMTEKDRVADEHFPGQLLVVIQGEQTGTEVTVDLAAKATLNLYPEGDVDFYWDSSSKPDKTAQTKAPTPPQKGRKTTTYAMYAEPCMAFSMQSPDSSNAMHYPFPDPANLVEPVVLDPAYRFVYKARSEAIYLHGQARGKEWVRVTLILTGKGDFASSGYYNTPSASLPTVLHMSEQEKARRLGMR